MGYPTYYSGRLLIDAAGNDSKVIPIGSNLEIKGKAVIVRPQREKYYLSDCLKDLDQLQQWLIQNGMTLNSTPHDWCDSSISYTSEARCGRLFVLDGKIQIRCHSCFWPSQLLSTAAQRAFNIRFALHGPELLRTRRAGIGVYSGNTEFESE